MFNKIAGAVLGTLLVLVALRIVGEAIFEPEEPAHEEELHEGGEVAAIDTTAGQEVAALCTGCHTVAEGGPNGFGPNLFGIVGRPVGGVDGFDYSEALMAMNAEGAVWTEELLDAFIHNPNEAAPGTTMPFGGMNNDEDRENLIIYLATLTPASAEAAEGGDDTEMAEGGDDGEFAAMIAAADPVAGETVAGQCAGCHTLGEGGGDGVGPHLWDIVGRTIGGVEGFNYSEALLALGEEGEVWTLGELDAFLENPGQAIPGNRMPFPGVADETDRHNLVAFLATLTANPPEAAPAEEAPAEEAPADEAPADEAAPAEEAPADEAAPAEETPAEEAAPADDAAAETGGDEVAMLLAGGDAEAGAAAAGQCAGCHTLTEGGANGFGPNLFGIVGRAVGGVEGFNYSAALAALNEEGATWTAELLDAFLENPNAAIPGNGMPFGGIGDDTERANLLAYLATLIAASEAAAAEDPGPPAAAEADAPADDAAAPEAAALPVEGEAVADDATPPAEDATPEADAPAEEAAPAADVAEAPAEEAAPADEAAPAEEAPVEEAAPAEEAEPAGDDEAAARVAAADPVAGEDVAGQCGFCHTFNEGGAASVGPNLFAIVDRPVGAVEGFLYSEALAGLNAEGATWTIALLDAFIADPATAIPGNRMPFTGIPDETERANLIAYLATLVPGAAEEEAAAAEEEPAAEEVAMEPAAFTVFQANWGDLQYGIACAACHGDDLTGGDGPALVGDDFVAAWTGRSVAEFIAAAHDGDEHPGDEVVPDDYAAIAAFIMRENGANGGPTALPAEAEAQAALALF